MNLDKKLEQNGIFPDEELKVDKKIEIAKFVAQGLCDNFKEFADMYNEFYMRIYNCKFYYAQIDSKFNGVFYYYKNNAIYIWRKNLEDDIAIVNKLFDLSLKLVVNDNGGGNNDVT